MNRSFSALILNYVFPAFIVRIIGVKSMESLLRVGLTNLLGLEKTTHMSANLLENLTSWRNAVIIIV